MLERLKSEGKNSPADLVFTADIGRLSDFKNAALTQPVISDAINDQVPGNLRDPENHWFGLTSRARIIVASKDRVAEGEIANYEDLADPKWQGRVCTRSGKHAYNVALISMMMSVHGEEKAESWLQGVKSNLARKPEGNDRGQVKAIKEGVCDIAVINHYYMFQMISDAEQKPWADAVRVIFPNQQDRGTHMNISGMAMAKHAPNPDNARKLMEFLASDKAQIMYAEVNGEYPVKQSITLGGYLESLGAFKRDSLALDAVAANRAEASKMVDRVAYNE
jgi:iron(III) transport system substrate-binding protein